MNTPTQPRHRRSRSTSRSGFTLIELLTVVAIIGILVAILLPVIGRVRENARSSRCVTNLRQVGVALQSYVNDHKGSLPPAGFYGVPPLYNRDQRNIHNQLLGYLDLKPATTWSTSVDNSYAPVFDCPSYKGTYGGKGYTLHNDGGTDPARDISGNTVKPWGFMGQADGSGINPQPQKLASMPGKVWAIRDLDAGSIDGSHPGYQNHLYFDWHIDRVAVKN